MPVDVLTEILIDRPRDQVARYGADPTNAPCSRWHLPHTRRYRSSHRGIELKRRATEVGLRLQLVVLV